MAGKVLVIGSTGTIGRAIVEELARRGERVKAASRDPKPWGNPLVETVRVDLTAGGDLSEAFADVDRVFAVSPAGYLNPQELLAPLIRQAAARGAKVVLQTAMGVDADDSIPLRQAERMLERSGVPFVILRPNWFADNFGTYWKAGLESGTLRLPAGEGATSFIDARDIAASAVAALTTSEFDGQAFALTGPNAQTYREATQLIGSSTGREVKYESIDGDTFVAEAARGGVPDGYARLLAAIFGPVAQGWAATVTDAVEKLTGRKPRSLADHLRDKPPLAA